MKSVTKYDDTSVTTDSFIPEEYDSLVQLVTITNNSDKEKKFDGL